MNEQLVTASQLTRKNPSPTLPVKAVIFMAELPPAPEQEQSPEQILHSGETVGLQARLLLGKDALNPTNTLTPITKEQLQNVANRPYAVIEDASKSERSTYWEGKQENNFARQKQEWSESLTSRFSDYAQFWESEKGKQWKETFNRIGINTTNLNPNQLYEQYFADEQNNATKQFSEKILAAYKKADGTLDEQKLMADKEALVWIGNIFGTTSSDIISELINAEVNIQTKPDQFISAVNQTEQKDGETVSRLNNLRTKERERLTFLQQHNRNQRPREPAVVQQESESTPEQTNLSRYQPRVEWFTSPDRAIGNIHDTSHLTRVLIWSEYITNKLLADGTIRDEDIDREAIRWVASLHDIRRENDRNDPGHTQRAGEWARDNLRRYDPAVSDETIEDIVTLTQIIDDRVTDETPEALRTMAKILKDADGLEFARFSRGAETVRKDWLHFDISRNSTELAQTFATTTQNKRSFAEVLREAEQLGLLPPHEAQEPTPIAARRSDNETREILKRQALNLINYDTGEITDERVDLSESFPELVQNTQTMLEHTPIDIRNGTVIFSDVAQAMVDRLAEEANNKSLELSFALQGVWMERNNKRVFVAAYPVPAVDFRTLQPTQTEIVPAIHTRNAIQLARQTNLENYFQEETGIERGTFGPQCHVHHEHLGQRWQATPSSQDYDQIKRNLEATPTSPESWGVVTKTGESLHTAFFYSTMQNGQPHHEPSLRLSEQMIQTMARPHQRAA